MLAAARCDNAVSACAELFAQVFCWGNGQKGQLGNGNQNTSYIPCKAGQVHL